MDAQQQAEALPNLDYVPEGATPAGAESAAWFRQALAEIGETQSGLARWMRQLGDDRSPHAILRSVQRMANGDARVSGEMRVILAIRLKRAGKHPPKV